MGSGMAVFFEHNDDIEARYRQSEPPKLPKLLLQVRLKERPEVVPTLEAYAKPSK